ncbi:MAG TPA: hypothetical protein VN732_03180 [Solirubrobacterales bacterium]|nr:hypothetical protein [Solirubrobacterales bacterium]
MPGTRTRIFIRVLVGSALCTALLTCIAVPVPEDLPAIAVGQAGLYRLEVALLTFYGWLLLVTPAFSGIVRGRLPIEISTRGAKFAEEVDQTAEANEAAIKGLELTTKDLTDALDQANSEIEKLKRERGDNR